ncbi:2-amino-4-hydroxy-6-hydroxymethyldihydropteridine diphosphokinase [Aquibacillus halophilus]|uniref:2-amino-4-hydroxy-6-hydroxymethyldihydropteridine diphosphokinase n=1 Tax=Aquibacillus halophilus TaxID=930132 RepID=A0A6A8DGZ1_9BACI|nr:2-amino-4-hydroxy-6-hydroxymethyldihydropteridine diphosphokinase [Aquibacillus halophilus]MRH44958.1 2-amino-4-hydroxy-6-hydroxymethyldihydropteridine diphosphokinase [Aquibacillus halophilus]
MNKAYVALGSNIAPRDTFLSQAINALDEHLEIKLTFKSNIYETEPMGLKEQEKFLNLVVEVSTSLEPLELLSYCQQIEEKLGRKRELRWGPRTIDLDILLYNNENIKTEQLIVPHPRMHERSFVLIPLKDIDPMMIIPTVNKTVSVILDETKEEDKKGVILWVPSDKEEE